MTNYFKIEGEGAAAISAIEAEMEALYNRTEKEAALLNDKIKTIIYNNVGISKEIGDNLLWTLMAKYYPIFGFYIAESEENNSLFKTSESIKPTIN